METARHLLDGAGKGHEGRRLESGDDGVLSPDLMAAVGMKVDDDFQVRGSDALNGIEKHAVHGFAAFSLKDHERSGVHGQPHGFEAGLT